MKPITLNSFESEMSSWLGARYHEGLPNVEGGWETWIQIDLVAYLNQSAAGNPEKMIDIRREARVYSNDSQRADLLLNADVVAGNSQLASTHPPLILEIKAQSYRVTLAATEEGIINDEHKLARANLKPEYQQAHRACLVAAIEQTLASKLSSSGFRKIASGNNVELYSKSLTG